MTLGRGDAGNIEAMPRDTDAAMLRAARWQAITFRDKWLAWTWYNQVLASAAGARYEIKH